MFVLSARSESRLEGVHLDLAGVIRRAIELTQVDFMVVEGLRSEEKQESLVASGASRTMRSRHLTGHAVDLSAMVGSEVRWDWPLAMRVAESVRNAANEQGKPIVWGGVWDKWLNDLVGDLDDDIAEYVARMRRRGRKAFLDGPHFQLPWAEYPAIANTDKDRTGG